MFLAAHETVEIAVVVAAHDAVDIIVATHDAVDIVVAAHNAIELVVVVAAHDEVEQ